MKPIKYKDKGPAVEDIQRRLRVLGYAIGTEGTSGTFLEETLAAVEKFQRANGIEPTGAVGPRTWSTLVDSSFELGDRMLYLRMPYFHGADVTQLQHALNHLGFVTGGADGIFGTSTEHAVTEFQANYDINPDGLVGNDTLRALFDLHHIWGGKEGGSHSFAKGTPQQQYLALMDFYFDFQAQSPVQPADGEMSLASCPSCDPAIQAALRRLVRYANNLEDAAREDLRGGSLTTPATSVLVRVFAGEPLQTQQTQGRIQSGTLEASAIYYQNDFKSFAASLGDLKKALKRLKEEAGQGLVAAGQIPAYELCIYVPLSLLESGTESSLPVGLQLMASRLLDALCLAAIE